MKNGTVNRAVKSSSEAREGFFGEKTANRKGVPNRKSGLEPNRLANVPHESGTPEFLATLWEFGGSWRSVGNAP